MTEEQSIFNRFGQIRDDLDQVQVAPDRQPALDALIAAQLLAEQSEAEYKRVEALLHQAARQRAEIAAKVPRSSFMDEHRAAVAAFGRR